MPNETTLSTGFKYTNNTESETKSVKLYDMSETVNYALVEKERADKVELDNLTAPQNMTERLIYSAKEVDKVNSNLPLPAKREPRLPNEKTAVKYQIELDADLVTLDSAEPTFRHDDPIVAVLTIIHPISPYVTDEFVGQHVERLVSACQHANGTWRFNEIRRSALLPKAD